MFEWLFGKKPDKDSGWCFTKEARWRRVRTTGDFVEEKLEVLVVNMETGDQEWRLVSDYAGDLYGIRDMVLRGFAPPYTRIRRDDSVEV